MKPMFLIIALFTIASAQQIDTTKLIPPKDSIGKADGNNQTIPKRRRHGLGMGWGMGWGMGMQFFEMDNPYQNGFDSGVYLDRYYPDVG